MVRSMLMGWSLDHFLHTYGVIGVALGAGLEGETAAVLGGAFARHGLFNPVFSAIAAWLGSFAADQVFFGLGRSQRNSRFVKHVAEKPAFTKALAAIERRPILFCVAFRFIYGFRVAGPVAIGVSKVPARLFLILNCVSAAVWGAIFTAIGYRFGKAFEHLLNLILTPAHFAIAAGIAAILVGTFLLRRRFVSSLAIDPPVTGG